MHLLDNETTNPAGTIQGHCLSSQDIDLVSKNEIVKKVITASKALHRQSLIYSGLKLCTDIAVGYL